MEEEEDQIKTVEDVVTHVTEQYKVLIHVVKEAVYQNQLLRGLLWRDPTKGPSTTNKVTCVGLWKNSVAATFSHPTSPVWVILIGDPSYRKEDLKELKSIGKKANCSVVFADSTTLEIICKDPRSAPCPNQTKTITEFPPKKYVFLPLRYLVGPTLISACHVLNRFNEEWLDILKYRSLIEAYDAQVTKWALQIYTPFCTSICHLIYHYIYRPSHPHELDILAPCGEATLFSNQ